MAAPPILPAAAALLGYGFWIYRLVRPGLGAVAPAVAVYLAALLVNANGINDAGDLTGFSDTSFYFPHAFRYRTNTLSDLGTLGALLSRMPRPRKQLDKRSAALLGLALSGY